MSHRYIQRLLLLVTLAASPLLLSCDRDPVEPRVEVEMGPRASVAGDGEYTLVEGRIPSDIEDLTVSGLIGVDGGSISLAGHQLTVPAGAVDAPTVFTMTLPSSGYVEVDLKAVQVTALGETVVEKFAQPVTLTLTYAWASNVTDPSALRILYMTDGTHDGGHELVADQSVDETGKTVSARLDHFSAYCMATD